MSQRFILINETTGFKRATHQFAEWSGTPIYNSDVLQEPRGNRHPAGQRPEPNSAREVSGRVDAQDPEHKKQHRLQTHPVSEFSSNNLVVKYII